MSATPDPAPTESALAAAPVPPAGRLGRRIRTLRWILTASATFLASAVLLFYPWLEWWDDNYFSAYVPLWSSGYLRGAVSGLGAVSFVLSLTPIARLRRG